jgi:protein O-mannosyl-transferase
MNSEFMEAEHRFGKRARNSGDALWCALLGLIAVVPYINTLWNGFVCDDDHQVLGNPYIRSFHFIRQILTTSVWSFKYSSQVTTNYYRPLMSLDYLLLYQTYGPLAYGFHLANVLTNAAVVIMLFAVTKRLFHSRAIAVVTALIFALHPVHVEAVAWVAAITDLQLALFLLVAFWLYLDVGDAHRKRWWTWPALCAVFSLALLCKEPAIAFPGIVLVYEHLVRADRRETNWKQKAARYAPLFVLVAIYLSLRMWFMGGLVPRLQKPEVSWPVAFLSSASLFNEYMNKLIWPVRLMMYYPFVPSTSLLDPRVLAGAAWAAGLCSLCLLLRKHTYIVTLGVFWMVATLAPTLNARWLPAGAFAERYLYVPSIGFSWLVALGLVALWENAASRKVTALKIAFACSALLLGILGAARIVIRNRDWHDDTTFYRVAVEQDPNNATLRADLGAAYWNTHHEAAAEQEWNTALADEPTNMLALFNLGIARLSRKQYPEAEDFLRRAIAERHYFTDAHLNLAVALEGMGRGDEAESEYLQALQLSPLSTEAHNSYASFLMASGRARAAQAQYEQSLAVLPTAGALDSLGDFAFQRSQFDLAGRYFRQAAELDRFDAHAHLKLVCIYAANGQSAEASREFQLGEMTDATTDPLNQEARAALDKLRQPHE